MSLQALKVAPTYSALALSLLLMPGPLPAPIHGMLPESRPAAVQVHQQNWKQLIDAGEKATLTGDFARAERSFKDALVASRGDSSRVIITLHIMDQFYEMTDQIDAEQHTLLNLANELEHIKGNDAELASVYSKLAAINSDTYQRLSEAYAKKAVSAYERAHQTACVDYGAVLDNLASLEASDGQYARAEAHYKLALSVFSHLAGPHDMVVGMIHNNLGELYMSWGQPDKAAWQFEQAINVLQPITPPSDSMLKSIKVRQKSAVRQMRLHQLRKAKDFVPVAMQK